MIRVKSLPPIATGACRILILGTVPGEESLRKEEYYADTRNQFWEIIYCLFNTKIDATYERKKDFLLNHRIAVWDVIAECDRVGSDDRNISNIVPNDFESFFKEYGNQWYIAFNGHKAAKLFYKCVGLNSLNRYIFLPSTSGANSMPRDLKVKLWETIFECLLSHKYLF